MKKIRLRLGKTVFGLDHCFWVGIYVFPPKGFYLPLANLNQRSEILVIYTHAFTMDRHIKCVDSNVCSIREHRSTHNTFTDSTMTKNVDFEETENCC